MQKAIMNKPQIFYDIISGILLKVSESCSKHFNKMPLTIPSNIRSTTLEE